MTIHEIYKFEDLSMRSYNVCKSNQLNTFQAILDYLLNNDSFYGLKNCGKTSNDELVAICKKYNFENINASVIEADNLKQNIFTHVILNLNRQQREVINSFIQISADKLTKRSQNAFNLYLENNSKIRNFYDKIIANVDFKIKNIKNIGGRSETELDLFFQKVKNFILEVNENNNENHLISLKNKFLIQNHFSHTEVPNYILEKNSFFSIINFLLEKDELFNKNQTSIFKNTFKIYLNSSNLSNEQIGENLKITRERVRQIKKKSIEDLFINLIFIRSFSVDIQLIYNIDTDKDLIIIDNQLKIINDHNNTNFSKEFITYILYVYLSDYYFLVGNIEDVLDPKPFNARFRHNWKEFYLVKKEIALEFDFELFVNDLNKRVELKIDETYSFNFKSYLSNFLINKNNALLNSISEICEKILNFEFSLFLDQNDEITFYRSTFKSLPEYIEEILEEFNEPTSIENIFSVLNKKHPGQTKSIEALRGSCNRSNSLIYFGRTSTYGLKKWEILDQNIKGGTIRNIVVEYLMKFDSPKRINLISEYVLKFRPNSYERSILDNLKADASGLFVFYKDYTVGLSNKNYDNKEYISLKSTSKKIKTWEESYELLVKFIGNEARLPSSSGNIENEIHLYRWFNIQFEKIKLGKLEPSKEALISAIINKFDKIKRRIKSKNTSIENYELLYDFVLNNNRIPSANRDEEKHLYNYFYNQRKKFENNLLDEENKMNFIKIAKILQNN